MGLKTRHIQYNMRQIKTEIDRDLYDKIVPKINWEKHGVVNSNPRIDKNKIIAKSQTSDFPAESITVRVTSAKNKRFTAYFAGKRVTRQFGGNQSYTYIAQWLKVPVDCSLKHCDKPIWHFTGEMPHDTTPEEAAYALGYIEDVLYGEQH